jgi:hypothetical protein
MCRKAKYVQGIKTTPPNQVDLGTDKMSTQKRVIPVITEYNTSRHRGSVADFLPSNLPDARTIASRYALAYIETKKAQLRLLQQLCSI